MTTTTENFTSLALQNLAVEAVSKGSIVVKSDTRPDVLHRVTTWGHEVVACTCEDYTYRATICKHRQALQTIITNHYPSRPRKVISAGKPIATRPNPSVTSR